MEETKELQTMYKIFRCLIYLSLIVEFFEYAIDPSFSLTFDQLLSNTVPLIEWYSTKTIKVAINYAALQALHYKQFNTYPSREQLRALIKKQFPQIKYRA